MSTLSSTTNKNECTSVRSHVLAHGPNMTKNLGFTFHDIIEHAMVIIVDNFELLAITSIVYFTASSKTYSGIMENYSE